MTAHPLQLKKNRANEGLSDACASDTSAARVLVIYVSIMTKMSLPGLRIKVSEYHPEALLLAPIVFCKSAVLDLFAKHDAVMICTHLRHLHAFELKIPDRYELTY